MRAFSKIHKFHEILGIRCKTPKIPSHLLSYHIRRCVHYRVSIFQEVPENRTIMSQQNSKNIGIKIEEPQNLYRIPCYYIRQYLDTSNKYSAEPSIIMPRRNSTEITSNPRH